jgi:hypothetical protein
MTTHASDEATLRAMQRFAWSNDHWADTWLPHIRVAALTVEYDGSGDIGSIARECADGWLAAREHLQGLLAILDEALEKTRRLNAN